MPLLLMFCIIEFSLGNQRLLKKLFTKIDVDDVGHSTEGIPISLEALELAEKVQDNSLVLNYLLSFSMEME